MGSFAGTGLVVVAWVVAAAAVTVGASGCASEPTVARLERPIIAGTPAPEDTGVVGLLDREGRLLCTGALIGPRAVLAAAHCRRLVDARRAFFGPELGAGGLQVQLSRAIVHPAFDDATLAEDVAVFLLDGPAPAEAGPPLALATRPPAVGEDVRFVGYGWTEIGQHGTYGLRTTLSAPVTEVAETTFRYGIATCNGDSGGPAFALEGEVEVIAGLTSFGDAACDEYGVDTRVDAYAAFIAEALATPAPACDADGQCGDACPVVDPDCPCQDDGLCEATCPDLGTDPDCPSACGADGRCLESCPRPDVDCAPVVDDDGGGCGCRVAPRGGGATGAGGVMGLLVLGLLGAVARRRVGSGRA